MARCGEVYARLAGLAPLAPDDLTGRAVIAVLQ